MNARKQDRDDLAAEIKALRERLKEAEETLEAIRSGGVDALVVSGPQGDRVYTLSGAAEPYRILIEEMNQGAATVSEEGVILYCNALFAELLAAPLERVIGAPLASYVVAADREKLAVLLGTGLSGRGADEMNLETPSGNTVPVRISVSCLPPHAGAAVCLVATDLTSERKREQTLLDLMDDVVRSKQAVEIERRRFFDVLETLPMMICLLTPDHRVPFANRAFRKRFGEVQGRSCHEIFIKRDAPCDFCEALKVLETGQPRRWEAETNGSVIDVYDFPFTDNDGGPMVLEMDMDITEWKQTQEKLRVAILYNRSLIEASLDPLVTIGADGKITDVNGATEAATGRPRTELIGTDFSDYFTDPKKARAGYQQAFRDGFVRDYELGLLHRDGHVMPVLYNASVYRDELGKVIGVFAAARDLTGRKRAEAEIRQLNIDLEQRVADRTRELVASEERFRAIYDMAPVSIWQEDWTEVIAMVRPLREEGVTDFAAWFQEHPEFVSRALAAVKILDVNQCTIDLFKARNKAEILASLETKFAVPGTMKSFIGELVALAQGRTAYMAGMNVSTVTGEVIYGMVSISFPPPGSDSGSVLVSIVDITARK